MKKKKPLALFLSTVLSLVIIFSPVPAHAEEVITVPVVAVVEKPIEPLIVEESVEEDLTEAVYYDNPELIGLITIAEAEGESEYGKRLVIDTILNRVDSEQFPDTVEDVVYQKNQFSCVWNGRANRVSANPEVMTLVYEEIASRTNSEVLYFTAGGYGRYGTPLFVEGGHYFCK